MVGPQSAGKSSALSRLSNVKFPTKTTRCTRVATLLNLRREEVEKPVTVLLRGQDKEGSPVEENFSESNGDTVSAVAAAQSRALDLFG